MPHCGPHKHQRTHFTMQVTLLASWDFCAIFKCYGLQVLVSNSARLSLEYKQRRRDEWNIEDSPWDVSSLRLRTCGRPQVCQRAVSTAPVISLHPQSAPAAR